MMTACSGANQGEEEEEEDEDEEGRDGNKQEKKVNERCMLVAKSFFSGAICLGRCEEKREVYTFSVKFLVYLLKKILFSLPTQRTVNINRRVETCSDLRSQMVALFL